jgi:hypothetical protein
MAGIIQQLTDITLTATPSVGSYLMSIDLDGVLKYKTDSGTISPVGGVGLNLIQEDLVSGLSFLPASGITHSEFFGPSGSVLLLQNIGNFTQNNLNSNFKILNVDNDPLGFGIPFAGVIGETASGSIQFINGSIGPGNIIGYFDSVNNETALIIQDNLGFVISYSDSTGSNSYGSNIQIGTNSIDLDTFDTIGVGTNMTLSGNVLAIYLDNTPSGLQNGLNMTDVEIKWLLATGSSFKVKYQDDPYVSPFEYELFEIGHNGDFRLSNNKATGTVSLLAGSASVINSLVTPSSIILTNKQNSSSANPIASVEQFGGSFSIFSSDPSDTATVGYFIINAI